MSTEQTKPTPEQYLRDRFGLKDDDMFNDSDLTWDAIAGLLEDVFNDRDSWKNKVVGTTKNILEKKKRIEELEAENKALKEDGEKREGALKEMVRLTGLHPKVEDWAKTIQEQELIIHGLEEGSAEWQLKCSDLQQELTSQAQEIKRLKAEVGKDNDFLRAKNADIRMLEDKLSKSEASLAMSRETVATKDRELSEPDRELKFLKDALKEMANSQQVSRTISGAIYNLLERAATLSKESGSTTEERDMRKLTKNHKNSLIKKGETIIAKIQGLQSDMPYSSMALQTAAREVRRAMTQLEGNA